MSGVIGTSLQGKPHVKVENNDPSIAEYDGIFFFS